MRPLFVSALLVACFAISYSPGAAADGARRPAPRITHVSFRLPWSGRNFGRGS
jgi:hypothetical protein